MTTTDIARIDAAALASLVTDVLGLALPAPDHLSISPHAVSSVSVPAINFQFNGPDKLTAVQAWADEFGTDALTRPDHIDPALFWVVTDFIYSDVRFHVYAPPERPGED